MTYWLVEVRDGRSAYRFKKESLEDALATVDAAMLCGFEARAWKVRKVGR